LEVIPQFVQQFISLSGEYIAKRRQNGEQWGCQSDLWTPIDQSQLWGKYINHRDCRQCLLVKNSNSGNIVEVTILIQTSRRSFYFKFRFE